MRDEATTRALGSVAAALWLAVGSSAATAQDGEPLDEGTVHSFILELGTATRVCDAQWFREHVAQGTQLTFAVKGKPPIVYTGDEYADQLERHCARTSFEEASMSIKMGQSRAMVECRWTGGTQTGVLFFDSRKYDWATLSLEIIRAKGLVKISRWSYYEVRE